MAIIKQDYGSLGNDVQTQMLIAPVLAEMIATQAFAIGDQFIVDNVLYKATKAISIGDAISVGTSTSSNCVLSDSITQQMKKESTSELIATTGTAQIVNVTADYSQYDFLYLTIGSGTGNYGSTILPVSTLLDDNYPKKSLYAYTFGGTGQFGARCVFNANSTPNTLATTDASYPAYLYGIKMK